MSDNCSRLLISDTLVPDIFIVRYMPQLSGDAISIYLWTLMTFHGEKFTLGDAASYGAISKADCEKALGELVAAGVLVRDGDGNFSPVDLKKVEVDAYVKSGASMAGEAVLKSDEKRRNVLATSIQKTFYLGNMQYLFYRLIDQCLYEYHFEDSVVYALFEEGRDLKIHFIYAKMSDLARKWYDKGYTTQKALNGYYEAKKRRSETVTLMGRLMRRRLNDIDLERIDRWTGEYGADSDLVEYAFRQNEWRGNITTKNVEDKLKEWHAAGISTIDKAASYEAQRHSENKAKSAKGRGRTNARRSGSEAGIVVPHEEQSDAEETPAVTGDSVSGDSILDMFNGDGDEDNN